jgi:hypothetical protein
MVEPVTLDTQQVTMIRAGEELSFLGEARQLKTSTSSFKYVPSDTIGVSKVVATKSGILDATSKDQ